MRLSRAFCGRRRNDVRPGPVGQRWQLVVNLLQPLPDLVCRRPRRGIARQALVRQRNQLGGDVIAEFADRLRRELVPQDQALTGKRFASGQALIQHDANRPYVGRAGLRQISV